MKKRLEMLNERVGFFAMGNEVILDKARIHRLLGLNIERLIKTL